MKSLKRAKRKRTCLPSDRDKDVEDADHDAPFAPSKEIAYDGRSDGGIAGFSGPDQAAQQGEKPELLHRQKHQRHSTCFLSTAQLHARRVISRISLQIRYNKPLMHFQHKHGKMISDPTEFHSSHALKLLTLRLSKLQLNVMEESLRL